MTEDFCKALVGEFRFCLAKSKKEVLSSPPTKSATPAIALLALFCLLRGEYQRTRLPPLNIIATVVAQAPPNPLFCGFELAERRNGFASLVRPSCDGLSLMDKGSVVRSTDEYPLDCIFALYIHNVKSTENFRAF